MIENYNAVIKNDCFSHQKDYWKVTIEANDLDKLNEICEWIRCLK